MRMFTFKKWNSKQFAKTNSGGAPLDNLEILNLGYELEEVGDAIENNGNEDT